MVWCGKYIEWRESKCFIHKTVMYSGLLPWWTQAWKHLIKWQVWFWYELGRKRPSGSASTNHLDMWGTLFWLWTKPLHWWFPWLWSTHTSCPIYFILLYFGGSIQKLYACCLICCTFCVSYVLSSKCSLGSMCVHYFQIWQANLCVSMSL